MTQSKMTSSSTLLKSAVLHHRNGFVLFLTAIMATLFAGAAALAQTGRATEPSSAPAPKMANQPVLPTSRPLDTGASSAVVTGEDWKGPRSTHDWDFSFSSGLGLLSGNAGVPIVFSGAKKVVHEGFVPDINNQVFIEAQTGPLFIKSETVWLWSAHLRWDFEQDERFRYFAVAGLGGNFVPKALGGRSEFFPRVGLGMFYSLTPELKARVDVSHEWITAGVTLALF